MRYPLTLTFKILAIAPQITLRDADGREQMYVRQKLLKLKEHIRVFRDSSQADLLHEIRADRVIDFRARYTFTDASGAVVGAVRRSGMRSLWKARYDVEGPSGEPLLKIEEENPIAKLVDGLVGEVPVVGMLTGLFLHPRYAVTETATNHKVLGVAKRRALMESRFDITSAGVSLPEPTETAALLAVLTMALLERERG
ncbi:MAG TPA: hypothetical protein VHQ65_10635 [Thermoanaerobaculia bacterium]|nr:hypothetical protein [Thermoanaerobaculia bacterium]